MHRSLHVQGTLLVAETAVKTVYRVGENEITCCAQSLRSCWKCQRFWYKCNEDLNTNTIMQDSDCQ